MDAVMNLRNVDNTGHIHVMGRDSSVGISNRHGLDGKGIECRWGRDFSQLSPPVLGPTQPPIKWVSGLFPEVMRPKSGVNHPPPYNAEDKARVELNVYSPSAPS